MTSVKPVSVYYDYLESITKIGLVAAEGAIAGKMTALALNSDRTADDILANGPLLGALKAAALVSGVAVVTGGDAKDIAIGANAGVNAAQTTRLPSNVYGANSLPVRAAVLVGLLGGSTSGVDAPYINNAPRDRADLSHVDDESRSAKNRQFPRCSTRNRRSHQ